MPYDEPETETAAFGVNFRLRATRLLFVDLKKKNRRMRRTFRKSYANVPEYVTYIARMESRNITFFCVIFVCRLRLTEKVAQGFLNYRRLR